MNLVLVFSPVTYDMICALLGTNWYALIGTLLIAALFIVHILYAITLTLQNKKARGNDKYASSNLTQTTWSSKNMFVLGIVLLLFLCLHLYDFWYKMQFSELFHLAGAEGRGSVIALELFKSPVHVILYVIGIIALWFHLSHGVWSMFQTVGINGRTWSPRLKWIGYALATLIAIGFCAVPVILYAKTLLCA